MTSLGELLSGATFNDLMMDHSLPSSSLVTEERTSLSSSFLLPFCNIPALFDLLLSILLYVGKHFSSACCIP